MVRAFMAPVGIATAVLVTLSAGASAKSLQEELAELIKYHPQIEASRKSIGSAGEGVNQSLSGYYPTNSERRVWAILH